MVNEHGHKFADLTVHAPKRWQVLTGKGMCAVMWLWIFYRAKNDGPALLGLRHPWDDHGNQHGHQHGNSRASGNGHNQVDREKQRNIEGAHTLSDGISTQSMDKPNLIGKLEEDRKSVQAGGMDFLQHREKLEQHPKVVSLIEVSVRSYEVGMQGTSFF